MGLCTSVHKVSKIHLEYNFLMRVIQINPPAILHYLVLQKYFWLQSCDCLGSLYIVPDLLKDIFFILKAFK